MAVMALLLILLCLVAPAPLAARMGYSWNLWTIPCGLLGLWKEGPPRAIKRGGIYSCNIGDQRFRIRKVLLVADGVVHTLLFKGIYKERPASMEPKELEVFHDHEPMSEEEFLNAEPALLLEQPVTPTQLRNANGARHARMNWWAWLSGACPSCGRFAVFIPGEWVLGIPHCRACGITVLNAVPPSHAAVRSAAVLTVLGAMAAGWFILCS
jgi:hypothetical protein